MSAPPSALELLGVRLALLDYPRTVDEIVRLAALDRASAVSFCNTHLVAEAAGNPAFREVLARFDLNLPDGMPLVWALNRRGAGLRDRVYGPYLMHRFFPLQQAQGQTPFLPAFSPSDLPTSSPPPSLRHFLFGSSPELLAKLAANLGGSNAGICGTFSPPFARFSEADNSAFAETIRAADPDCIWVALGGVRQETWIAENLHRFPRGVFLAVGDAFSLLAGESRFAPAWMQKAGLTWLYRLVNEPGRLWKRYLVNNTRFLWHLALSGKVFSL